MEDVLAVRDTCLAQKWARVIQELQHQRDDQAGILPAARELGEAFSR